MTDGHAYFYFIYFFFFQAHRELFRDVEKFWLVVGGVRIIKREKAAQYSDALVQTTRWVPGKSTVGHPPGKK
jgi:hypothetical protein